jgi:hypothetical protein
MIRSFNSKTLHHGLPESFRIKRVLDLGALALILGTVALPVPTASAADYEIVDLTFATNGGATMYSAGDTLTITATGSVTTTGQSGVETMVGGTTITHNGPITTTGDGAMGISVGSRASAITGDVTILGLGSIATGGDFGYGILSRTTLGDATIAAGDISTTGSNGYGIFSLVTTGNATITAGNISTTGSHGNGIFSLVTTGNATITAGNISTTGIAAVGISSQVNTGNATISAGNISTTGDGAHGIYSDVTAGNATITAGNISTTGIAAHGIVLGLDTGNATISAGNISTTGDGADGIYAGFGNLGAANLSFVNDYNIAVSGVNARGIYLGTLNDNSSIVNNGTISSAQSYGIYTNGSDTIITNSGMISGTLGAVKFAGTGNTLSLLAGSNVQGILDLAGDGGNSLVIGRRLNTALRFTAVPEVATETNGMPYVAFGGILAVVDPTLFAAEDVMVADLSRSVGNAIDARLGSAVGQSANTIMASTSNAQATGPQWDTWATGLASYRQQGEEGLYDGFDTTLGGFALGSDTVLSSGTRFGGFVGASRAHLNTNAGNEQIDSASTYAGIYAGYTLPNAFVNLGLIAGYADAETSRDVLNNMVAGGIEQAKGAPDGTFLTPQATIGTQIKTSSGILTPSLRVAYTHLAMDSYVETGSLANMTVAARTVSTLDLRGQVAFAIKPIATSTGQIDATMRLGADATFTNSDDITATVLSQPLTFSTTQDTALRGFAGLDLAQAMDNGAKLNLSVEAGYGTNSALTLQGTAGVVWAF